jgi:hypothetical protein
MFEIMKEESVKLDVFWGVAPYSLVSIYWTTHGATSHETAIFNCKKIFVLNCIQSVFMSVTPTAGTKGGAHESHFLPYASLR